MVPQNKRHTKITQGSLIPELSQGLEDEHLVGLESKEALKVQWR